MDSTDRFVLEERDSVRKQTTVRLIALGALSLAGLLVFSSARCSVHQSEEETKREALRVEALPMEIEIKRAEAAKTDSEAQVKKAQVEADRAVRVAEAQKKGELAQVRVELHGRCSDKFGYEYCDTIYRPELMRAERESVMETRRMRLGKELYEKCLASNTKDKYCDEKMIKMVQGIRRAP